MSPKTAISVPLFGDLPKRKVREITPLADELDVPAGTELTRDGEYAREFFIVLEGTAEVVKDGEVVATLGPGEFFGEVGLLDTVFRTATVVATTPMKLVVVAQREFRTLLSRLPDAAREIEQAASARA